MTIDSQSSDESQSGSPAEQKGAGKPLALQLQNMIGATMLALVAGALVAGYVLWVSHFTVHQNFSDATEQAAIETAKRLTRITVQHPSFGRVGLCDLPAREGSGGLPKAPRTVGLNTLYATLRLDLIIAGRLHNQVMTDLVLRDLEEARKLEQELRRRLYRSVEQSPDRTDATSDVGAIYEQTFQELSAESARRQRKLNSLKIILGTLQPDNAPCVTSAPRPAPGAGSDSFVKNGLYRPFQPVPVNGAAAIYFYPVSDKIVLVDQLRFRRDPSQVIPSVVLIEAGYLADSQENAPGQDTEQMRAACAVTGAPTVKPEPSAFMLNFPQGPPPQFSSITSMLVSKHWLKPGQWQQAIRGKVPGSGSLGPLVENDPGDMMPGDALAMSLYHWLRYAGNEIDPESVLALLQKGWLKPAAPSGGQSGQNAEQAASINSCLVRETGARLYAILNQTGPSGAGQIAISNAFAAATPVQVRPGSALPLSVDTDGNVNLPGACGFDKELVASFFNALHKTNLAGVETQSVASALTKRAEAQLAQLDRKVYLQKEELTSLRQRRERMEHDTEPPSELANQLILLSDRMLNLEQSIASDEADRKRYQKAIQLAQIAASNGQKATLKSFDICSRMAQLAVGGLTRENQIDGVYLLSKRWIFVAHPAPVLEEDILAAASSALPATEKLSEWLSREFKVWQECSAPKTLVKVEPQGLAGSKAAPPSAEPTVVILDSEAVERGGAAALKVYRRAAFSNVGIPAGQLFYYAENALQSGAQVKLSWSVVGRDLVAVRSDRFRGDAQASSELNWCRQGDVPQTACPGLACEFQVCAPLPVDPGFETDIYLTNPSNLERMPLVPPVPSGMI
jgi:hypothetical protein